MNKITIETLKNETMRERNKRHSAWSVGITYYCLELLDSLEYNGANFEEITNPKLLEKKLLNGADNWSHYSYGGCSLCYDEDICERLCTPSERKKKKDGYLMPNSCETWLDVQARALFQASRSIVGAYLKLTREAK